MSGIVRVVVAIDADWRVTIACPELEPEWGNTGLATHQMGKVSIGGLSFPAPVQALHDPNPAAPPSGPPTETTLAELEAVFATIIERRESQVDRYGHYLFDALLGADRWEALTQIVQLKGFGVLQLALAIPSTDLDLLRLNWEMMRSEDAFLVAGTPHLDVALTRHVMSKAVTAKDATPLDSPPRYLYVIGTTLDDEAIRPGAELMGLLRQVRDRRRVNHRILERASPSELRKTLNEFQPDVVHFICHGDVDENGPFLDLRQDDGEEQSPRYPVQLIQDLRRDDRTYPKVVLLSACNTAGAGGTERYVLGVSETAPLATQLIEAGVPIVLGMSGRITDLACRLFTRSFSQAVVNGATLVGAVAQARMAAFAGPRLPVTTPDWALPSLFMADAVPPDYTPMPAERQSGLWQDVEGWINDARLRADPVFCGRVDLFAHFRSLYIATGPAGPGRQVLAIHTLRRGLGSRRLLQELAIAALWDGNLPILITPPQGDTSRTLRQFANAFVPQLLESPYRPDRADVELAAVLDGNPQDAAIQRMLKIEENELTPWIVWKALRIDLDHLLADAAVTNANFSGPASRVIVLLDDIDRWGPEVVNALFQEEGPGRPALLGPSGLGTSDQSIPVVMTFSLGGLTDGVLRGVTERKYGGGWMLGRELRTFSRSEDMLAYRWVLLNPAHDDPSKLQGQSWTFADLQPKELEDAEQTFRDAVKGIPSEMTPSGKLYKAAERAIKERRLVQATDEDALALVTVRL